MTYLNPDDDRELYREYLNRRPTPAEPARMKYGPTYQWEEYQLSAAWMEWEGIDGALADWMRNRLGLRVVDSNDDLPVAAGGDGRRAG